MDAETIARADVVADVVEEVLHDTGDLLAATADKFPIHLQPIQK